MASQNNNSCPQKGNIVHMIFYLLNVMIIRPFLTFLLHLICNAVKMRLRKKIFLVLRKKHFIKIKITAYK